MGPAADQGQRNPDRQQESRQDQEEFGGRRKSGEPAGNAHRADKPESGSLAELTNEVEKVVGNGFAQSIVVNRAQRAAEIGRSLLARILVGRLRLLRTLCVRRFIRVASLLALNLSSPHAGLTAPHTNLFLRCNAFNGCCPERGYNSSQARFELVQLCS